MEPTCFFRTLYIFDVLRFKTSVNSEYDEAHCNLGVIFREQGRLEEAIGAYQKALSINPNFAEVYNNLGFIYLS